MSGRSWYRDYFVDHPGLASKDPAAMSSTLNGKPKIICQYCFPHLVEAQKAEHAQKLVSGLIQSVHDKEMIIRQLFNTPVVIQAWGSTMNTHLHTCWNVPLLVKQCADTEKANSKVQQGQTGPPMPTIQHSMPVAGGPSPYFPQSQPPMLLMGMQSHNPGSFELPSPALSFASLALSDSVSSLGASSDLAVPLADPHATQQAQFEERITWLTASAGFALSWVENPEFRALIQEFMPYAKIPTRKVLTNHLLPKLAQSFREHAQLAAQANSANVTAQCPEAFTADASGESRKAWKLLVQQQPSLVAPDCFAHQINIIVGDYFKVDKGFMKFSKQATELITWIQSKTYVLALIQDAQVSANVPVVTVIRAVLTRWTSHYLAFRRLLEMQATLEFTITRDQMLSESQIITGDKKSKEKAAAMIKLIEKHDFWLALVRLDEVLLTFGVLYHHFNNMHDPVENYIRTAVLNSLESQWKKCDQEVLIAAVLLNPFMESPFSQSLHYFNRAGVLTLFTRLYAQFFTRGNEDYSSTLIFRNLNDYYTETGPFSGAPQFQAVINRMAQENVILVLTLLSFGMDYIFGNTLTKLRNRLGTKTLTLLAEIKMHVWDEHLAKRVKQEFGLAREERLAKMQEASKSMAPIISLSSESPEAPTDSHTTATSSDIGINDTEVEDEFQEITSNMEAMADDDDDADIYSLTFPSQLSISLENLFDFTARSWIDVHNVNAVCSLAEELEFFMSL
ncbi:hypothetical protein BT96DRAFT_1044832 [Gymnopus androsaceus JB14]|uniref:DUF659 domain-containing protein n=1 Tax=Gymnopus androsaceus JB14 TaxID=1447944 RepID=A0A6A4HDA4_9AGAR|nr:hypothetical protein BT96DRAFT_1044832 [Gymnopus androsaceus JB14]